MVGIVKSKMGWDMPKYEPGKLSKERIDKLEKDLIEGQKRMADRDAQQAQDSKTIPKAAPMAEEMKNIAKSKPKAPGRKPPTKNPYSKGGALAAKAEPSGQDAPGDRVSIDYSQQAYGLLDELDSELTASEPQVQRSRAHRVQKLSEEDIKALRKPEPEVTTRSRARMVNQADRALADSVKENQASASPRRHGQEALKEMEKTSKRRARIIKPNG